eukprot:1141786-Pelagomonas_calceolata.AAC.2
MESTIHMVTFWEGSYKASGSSEADCMCLIVEGACAVLEDCAFHSGWDAGYIPEGIANALICIRVWTIKVPLRLLAPYGPVTCSEDLAMLICLWNDMPKYLRDSAWANGTPTNGNAGRLGLDVLKCTTSDLAVLMNRRLLCNTKFQAFQHTLHRIWVIDIQREERRQKATLLVWIYASESRGMRVRCEWCQSDCHKRICVEEGIDPSSAARYPFEAEPFRAKP